MKYLFFLFLLFCTPQSDRSLDSLLIADQSQFKIHTNEDADGFLRDEELQKTFPVSDYFYPSTRFWFLIYTHFDDSKLILHDRNNLNLIYHVQDFSSLETKKVHPYAQSYIQEQLINKKIEHLRERLLKLAETPLPSSADQVALYNQVLQSGIKIGPHPEDHRRVFTRLAKGIRAQRGLKNHIEQGISRYNLYSKFTDKYFSALKLPAELISIAFLESSFNPDAHSKSRAAGVWQLMPFLKRSFFPNHSKIDYRLNIGISSVAAAQLLQENFQILKRWDLALTAYNSGIKHILKLKKDNPDLTLEMLIKRSEYSNFGFASKNFYAEFLALTRVLKYRDQLFPSVQAIDPLNDLKFYFAKCDINLVKGFSPTEREYLKSLNHQIRKVNIIKKGTLITTDSDLSPIFYENVSWNDLIKKRPKLWMDPKKRYSCSTR